MAKFFIDASEFNTIDWAKAKDHIGHAYIRIGLRGSLKETAPADYKKIRFDHKWDENLAGARKYKIPYGPYYFPTCITRAEAVEEAKWLYSQIKDLDISLPPMLDSENVWGKNHEPGRANDLSREERTKLLKVITDYLNDKGINCGIYASASWLTSKIDMSAFPQRVINCTWVADSTGAVDYAGYYWLHQYGQGSVPGISEKIDLNAIKGKIPAARISDKPVEQKRLDPIDVMIQIMNSQVGYHEGANNHTKYGDEMHRIQPSNMDANAPWCDCWFDWCILKLCEHYGYGADMARKVLCGNFDDYTYSSVALYKKAGRWTQTPHKGDQIFFGGEGHTGGVTRVYGGVVFTDEGNKGDEVRKCSYSIHSPSIIGYGRPRYELLTGGKPAVQEDGILRVGSSGKAVRFLQLALGGLNDDGDFGPKTEAKVKAFQKAHRLVVDGEVGPDTWEAIKQTLPLLKRGSTGRYVEALQVALAGLNVDGKFGKKTYDAVTAFQRESGLESDGEVGQLTWGAIIADLT